MLKRLAIIIFLLASNYIFVPVALAQLTSITNRLAKHVDLFYYGKLD